MYWKSGRNCRHLIETQSRCFPWETKKFNEKWHSGYSVSLLGLKLDIPCLLCLYFYIHRPLLVTKPLLFTKAIGYRTCHIARARSHTHTHTHTHTNGAVSKVDKKFISHPTRAQYILSVAGTVQVSYALPAVRFSCLLQGRETSF
jgi:hypothetical protein